MSLSDNARLVLGRGFRQPDQRSCGAAVLVVAEALRNDRYARRLLAGGEPGFRDEALAMHRRVTGPVDVTGALQLPWTRLLGTPPWAAARQLGRRRAVWARHRSGRAWTALTAALATGDAVPVYVGSRWLPRHVVLAVDLGEDGGVRAYEPSSGRVVRLTRDRWTRRALRTAGWSVPWWVLVPAPADREVSRGS